MKLRDGGLTVAIIIGVALFIGYMSGKWLGHDNVIEEAGEAVIEEVTGFDIDLSPKSPDGVHHYHADGECE